MKLDGEAVKSKRVKSGTSVRYVVSKAGYVSQTGDVTTTLSDDGKTITKDITLVAENAGE